MDQYSIKNTTKSQRIQLIKEWQEPEDCAEGSGIDLFDMYAEYINGTKEISQINQEYHANYILGDAKELEESADQPGRTKSTADEIRELKALLDEGILSQEEFDAGKKKVLGL